MGRSMYSVCTQKTLDLVVAGILDSIHYYHTDVTLLTSKCTINKSRHNNIIKYDA